MIKKMRKGKQQDKENQRKGKENERIKGKQKKENIRKRKMIGYGKRKGKEKEMR